MYICVCHGVSEKDIQKAVEDGASTIQCLQAVLKVATCCGACVDHALECLSKDPGRPVHKEIIKAAA